MTLPSLPRAIAIACALFAAAAQAAPPSLDAVVERERAGWREHETQRLAQRDDRDALIAAVLLGMPGDGAVAASNQAAARQRLKQKHGSDPLAAFALAWSCRQASDCKGRDDVDALVRLAPDNAVGWLLQPHGEVPDAAALHAAARADHADSQMTTMLRIVREALANAAPPAAPGTDARELALALRRDATDRVPLPVLGGVVTLCKTPAPALRDDCLAVGRHLMADRSGAILFRMVGSAMTRRLVPGTPEAEAAKALRRDYVWMGEQAKDASPAERERVQADVASVGEWEAWQRAAQRKAGMRTPPPGWAPADPSQLLLPEERASAPST